MVSCRPALSTAGMKHWTDSQLQRAEQQICSASMVELLSLPLNCSLFAFVCPNPPATLQEVGCVGPTDAHVFSAHYISMPGATLSEAEQLKQA